VVDHQRRRQPEGDHVREAVVLGAEIGLRACQARDAPVEAVEDRGDEQRHGGGVVPPAHGGDDSVEAREEGARRRRCARPFSMAST